MVTHSMNVLEQRWGFFVRIKEVIFVWCAPPRFARISVVSLYMPESHQCVCVCVCWRSVCLAGFYARLFVCRHVFVCVSTEGDVA